MLMTSRTKLRARHIAPTAYAVYNPYTGGYIHDSMMKLKTFPCKAAAEEYINRQGLNKCIFIPVEIGER